MTQPRRSIVLKFGGTSVSGRARWDVIADVVEARLASGLLPVVVCSALGGVSNLLEKLLRSALAGEHGSVLADLRKRHERQARELEVDLATCAGDLEELERLVTGISLTRDLSPRLHAQVLAVGELLSTRLGAAFLVRRGLPVTWVDARDCLVACESAANPVGRILSATCGHERDDALRTRFAEMGGAVVTQGFIARDTSGKTVLLGRGGSDTSAAYFAARLGAERCEIWTDVPGMYSANPRQVPAARLLQALHYDEAQEIASMGGRVLHPRCLAPLRAHGIPLQIRSTVEPDVEGTTISADVPDDRPGVRAISSKSGIVLVSMETVGMWQQVGFLADTFARFKSHGLSIDLVSTSETNVTVSLDVAANAIDPERLDGLVRDLSPLCTARVIGPCAAVSLIGRNIRAILHKLGPTLEVFEEQQVHLVSQAASDLNLTFVVDEDQADRLVGALHSLLLRDRESDRLLGPTWGGGEAGGARAAADRSTRWWEARAGELLEAGVGDEPLYVYDARTLHEAVHGLGAVTSVDRVLYAVKANAHPEILRVFHDAGLGFECVSPGEVRRILDLFSEIDRRRVLFTPNFAPRADYSACLAADVNVTVDNLHPLEAWPDLFRGREVFVRLDPGVGRGHHDYVKTAGSRSKFGIAGAQLERLESLTRDCDTRVVGIHAHSGSGVRQIEGWRDTGLVLAAAAERFPDTRVLDLGGGLAVPEKPGDTPLDLQELDAQLSQLRAAHPRFELWLEPGRFLVAEAGVLLARVTQLKRKANQVWVGTTAGMHTLLRPALYGAYHEIVNLSRLGEPRTMVANIVGPICETGDTLGYERAIAPAREGDVLLFATVGAYGCSMSSGYNLRGAPRERMLAPPG